MPKKRTLDSALLKERNTGKKGKSADERARLVGARKTLAYREEWKGDCRRRTRLTRGVSNTNIEGHRRVNGGGNLHNAKLTEN